MTTKREKWDVYYMGIAHKVKELATCPRKAVGAVVVNRDNEIAGTGYNGAPRGMPHCSDVGCLMDEANHCTRVMHAEVNAVLQALKRGEINGATMYVTVFPCVRCLNQMIQAGIRRVVYEELYRSDAQIELATVAGLVLESFPAACPP